MTRFGFILSILLVSAGCQSNPPHVPAARTEPAAPAPEVAPAPVAAELALVIHERRSPPETLTDDQLLEIVQHQTFRYFWDFGHPVSGLARERSRVGERPPALAPLPTEYFTPPDGAPGEHGLLAEYYDNTDLHGDPVFTRIEPLVDLNWGDNGPGGTVPADGFSARLSGRVVFPTERHIELGIGSDDGSRLLLDGRLIIDNWSDHGYSVIREPYFVEAGVPYKIEVEFYENAGAAMVRFGEVLPEGTVEGDPPLDSREDTCAVGGSGFGVMAMLVAAERGWVTRDEALERVAKIVSFLEKAEKFHGVLPHWMDGSTGKAIPFSEKDDGGDLVETSYMMAGLLSARRYFDRGGAEAELRAAITRLWEGVEWDWHTRGGMNVLFWHWSPKYDWAQDHAVRGWNECLITYILAASSPTHAIEPAVYHEGWAADGGMRNGAPYLGITLPLGWELGGPLFFAHYTFLGIDPRGLKDRYADYWEQNVNHTLINRAYCIANPRQYEGYGSNCWGLTASDNYMGYGGHSPTEDLGVISPTAALSSFPYTPDYSMEVLRHFYEDLGDRIWSEYGFVDAFCERRDWYAKTCLAIDQGPIVVMIENHRSGLLWRLLMGEPEVKAGLRALGFESPHLDDR
ncbi:MAG TPA: glucoamylase family protein [Kiritimatiellia bacterium]|jgi:hypothetical protein